MESDDISKYLQYRSPLSINIKSYSIIITPKLLSTSPPYLVFSIVEYKQAPHPCRRST